MLDKLSPILRHFILIVMAAVIANGANWITGLHLSQLQASFAGVVLTMLIAVFTPITKQYGVGATKG